MCRELIVSKKDQESSRVRKNLKRDREIQKERKIEEKELETESQKN